jgi:predicted NUDIX family phosphoesterase
MKKSLAIRRRDAASILGIPPVFHPDTDTGTVSTLGPLPTEFLKLPFFLIDSKRAAEDPVVDFEHLHPTLYLALQDQATQRLYVYERTPSGDKTRLQGLCSIGVEGSLEEPPSRHISLAWVFTGEADRLLEEEVGVMIYEDQLGHLYDAFKDPSQVGFIYRNDTALNATRVAVTLTLSVEAQLTGQTEDQGVGRGRWLSLDELRQDIADGVIRLESWSEMLLDLLIESPRVVPLPP